MARPKGDKPATRQVRLYGPDKAGLMELAVARRRTAEEVFRQLFGSKLDKTLADVRAKAAK